MQSLFRHTALPQTTTPWLAAQGHNLTDDWSLPSAHFVDSLCPFRCLFRCVLLLNQMFWKQCTSFLIRPHSCNDEFARFCANCEVYATIDIPINFSGVPISIIWNPVRLSTVVIKCNGTRKKERRSLTSSL